MDSKQMDPKQPSSPKTEDSRVCDYDRAYLRAENEDDDGYDPYSDRPAPREPLFEEDPWA